jgi:hypothetical protein
MRRRGGVKGGEVPREGHGLSMKKIEPQMDADSRRWKRRKYGKKLQTGISETT